ncbi:MAG: 4-amino-4-deoxy-L-arabinose transferase [Nocardioides sp.]|uniref:4-amino-4-deoxy-L-arabinose transferase n=1 Tax=Nocardioides sp. TaxID=35761 RepID=UPI0039E49C1A
MTSAVDPTAAILDLVRHRPARLGAGRLLSIEGPAGAGKSSLAAGLRQGFGAGSVVVAMDELYDGWDGLASLERQLDSLLLPLAADRCGRYRRYDWHAGRYAETVTVAPADLLILEGVGSGLTAYDHLRTALVFLDAPTATRKQRALARDGDSFAPYWDRWAAAEADLFARERTRERADLVVPTG